MLKYDAIFFDFDGVLADSVEVKTQAFVKMFEAFGPDVQEKVKEHHRNNGGMSRFDKLYYYYQTYIGKPLTEKQHSDLCDQFSNLVVDEVVKSREITGATDFLNHCYSLFPCFIISGTPETEMKEIVKRRSMSKYFKQVLGSPTNKTDNLNKLLDQYNYNPANCLFWGDSNSDYSAADNCNVKFIGILPDENAPLLKTAPGIEWVKDFTYIDKQNF